jgi:hypothetical protein
MSVQGTSKNHPTHHLSHRDNPGGQKLLINIFKTINYGNSKRLCHPPNKGW